jgi:hypothetical protein
LNRAISAGAPAVWSEFTKGTGRCFSARIN